MAHAREDNAIEVYHGGLFVGWLTSVDGSKVKGVRYLPIAFDVRMAEVDGLPSFVQDDVVDQFPFEIAMMTRDFSRQVLDRCGGTLDEIEIATAVPTYAVRTLKPHAEGVRFVWQAIRCSTEEFEMIFDHPDFEAYDSTDLDMDTIAVTRMPGRMDVMFGMSVLKNPSPLFTTVGIT